jgi:hypothetical protein
MRNTAVQYPRPRRGLQRASVIIDIIIRVFAALVVIWVGYGAGSLLISIFVGFPIVW